MSIFHYILVYTRNCQVEQSLQCLHPFTLFSLTKTSVRFETHQSVCYFSLFVRFSRRPLHLFGKNFPLSFLFLCISVLQYFSFPCDLFCVLHFFSPLVYFMFLFFLVRESILTQTLQASLLWTSSCPIPCHLPIHLP